MADKGNPLREMVKPDSPVADYMLDRAGVDRLAKYLNGGMAGVTGLGSAMSFGSMPYMGPWNAIPGTIFGAQSLGYMADAARAAQNEQMHRQGAEMWNQNGMQGRPLSPDEQAMQMQLYQQLLKQSQGTMPPQGE